MDNYTVPPNETTVYLCKMFRVKDVLPQYDSNKTLQIIELKSIIASKQVHHSVLVKCNKNAKFKETYLGHNVIPCNPLQYHMLNTIKAPTFSPPEGKFGQGELHGNNRGILW